MRTPIIAGNWKLNKNPQETTEFVNAVKAQLPKNTDVETLICAPAVDLPALIEAAKGSELHVGAENCYFEDEGAYTGETSPKVLNEMGINYVIIGHSERRGYFHETDEDINKKAKAIFANNMKPILCCGESLETREAGKAEEFVEGQIKADLEGLSADQVSNMVIAYSNQSGQSVQVRQRQLTKLKKCVLQSARQLLTYMMKRLLTRSGSNTVVL